MDDQVKKTIQTLAAMVEEASNALKAISGKSVIFQFGDIPPERIAASALDTMRELHTGAREVAEKEESIPSKQVPDGGVIRFGRDFDVMYHQCCSCKLIHEVRLSWEGDELITTWKRCESRPTKADIINKGGEVV